MNGGGGSDSDDSDSEGSPGGEGETGGGGESATATETATSEGATGSDTGTPTEGDGGADSYTVQANDTLSEITAAYNEEHGTSYSYQEVADANGIENPDVIHPGDEIDFSSLGEGKGCGKESDGEPAGEGVPHEPDDDGQGSGSVSDSADGGSGGRQIDNTNEAVANASPGDYLVRDDGTTVVVTQGDITWAQEQLAKDETKSPTEGKGDSTKESENSKEISVVANEGKIESNYIDEKEASRARAEAQLIAQKNSELNSPKCSSTIKGIVGNTLKDPGTLTGFIGDFSKESAKSAARLDLSVLTPTSPLMNYSNTLSKLGSVVVLYDIGLTAINEGQNVKEGNESVVHAFYNTITHGISAGAGCLFGATVTACATASTLGVGSVPGLAAGIIAGTSVTTVCETLFNHIEEKIW